jgi:4-aminobutyrate--pyruvate transaminase
MNGIELVANKVTRAQFDPALGLGAAADRYARENGLITRFFGDRIAFSPPLIITEPEIDEAVVRITRALDAAWREIQGA